MSKNKKSTLSYKEKSSLHFVEQEEPAFIKEMKKKMGFKAPAKLEDKFDDEALPDFDSDETELMRLKEEDRPQVVVLNSSTDLSKEELDKEIETKKKEEDDKKIAEGKITFKKPTKRTADEDDSKKDDEKKKSRNAPAEIKVQKSLLSFGDDEEEEDE